MSTIKTVLCLLAFLCVYGVVGRMDYDDAVMLENAQRQVIHMSCRGTDSFSSANQVQPLQIGLTDVSGESADYSADSCNVLIY